jgi:hypothetical protein
MRELKETELARLQNLAEDLQRKLIKSEGTHSPKSSVQCFFFLQNLKEDLARILIKLKAPILKSTLYNEF